MKRVRTFVRKKIAWLALPLLLAPPVLADPIQVVYSTSGTVGTAGLTGAPVFSFQGVSNGAITTGQPFNLGQFVTDGPPSPGGTDYVNTPFQITFTVQTINGVAPSPNDSPVTLDGLLNGTIPFNSTPFVHMNFDSFEFVPEDGPPFPTTVTPFLTGSYMNYLYITSGPDVYAPVQAELNLVQNVPEPSAIIIFGIIGATLFGLSRQGSINPVRSVVAR